MRKTVLGFVVFLVFSCTPKVAKEDITKLNGYWEIQQVKMATGETKDYKVNETIDYFELQQAQIDNKWVGFRQKVMPQFDGKFLTNGIKEIIKIKEDKNTFFVEWLLHQMLPVAIQRVPISLMFIHCPPANQLLCQMGN